MSLFLTIIFIQIALFAVNAIGAATINEVAYSYFGGRNVKTHQQKRGDLLKLRKELHSISATDEFTRWARKDREYQKADKEFKDLSNSLQAERTAFDRTMNMTRTASLTILPWILQWYYSKSPIFSYPKDFLPTAVQRALSFASAPNGTVSIGTFNMVCGSVIPLIGNALLSLVPAQTQKTREKIAMAAKK